MTCMLAEGQPFTDLCGTELFLCLCLLCITRSLGNSFQKIKKTLFLFRFIRRVIVGPAIVANVPPDGDADDGDAVACGQGYRGLLSRLPSPHPEAHHTCHEGPLQSSGGAGVSAQGDWADTAVLGGCPGHPRCKWGSSVPSFVPRVVCDKHHLFGAI